MYIEGVNTEWLIVSFMVTAAILSAASYYQATVFSDEASSLIDDARFAGADDAQSQSGFQAQVIHDRRVLLGCLTALDRRDSALREYSESFGPSALRTVVAAEQTRIALQALLLADSTGDCEKYSVANAADLSAFISEHVRLHGGDPAALLERSGQRYRAESIAISAAVIFALVLLLLTLADSTARRRWIAWWFLAAVLGATAGGMLAVLALATAGAISLFGLLAVLALSVALAVVALIIQVGPSSRAGVLVKRRVGSWPTKSRRASILSRPVRWWAELFGAATLVAFALGVLGYSASANEKRQSEATADRLTLQARHALELGEQSALAALTFVAQESELRADIAAAQDPLEADRDSDPTGSDRAAANKALLADLWQREQEAWDELYDAYSPGENGGQPSAAAGTCLDRDLVLAWGDNSSGEEALPAALLRAYRTDTNVLVDLIAKGTRGSTACWVQSALSWQDAHDWGVRASLFTVALVVLGLAGFLFALGADPERNPGPRRWLLTSGLAGLVGGASILVAAWISTPVSISDEARREGSRAYANSVYNAAGSRCAEARGNARDAVRLLPNFGEAHVAIADAAACSLDNSWLIAPFQHREHLMEFYAGLRSAVEDFHLSNPVAVGNLGWADMLIGVTDAGADRESSLKRGIELTRQALVSDPQLPSLCFNLAFGLLADGERSAAQAQYELALASLSREADEHASCEPVDFTHAYLQRLVRLSALADLELLSGADDVDSLRELIVTGSSAAGDDADPATDGFELAFYPHGLMLTGDGVDKLTGSAVWYYRPTDAQPWAVARWPSSYTLDPSSNLSSFWPMARVMPPGQYRVDIYQAGRLTHRITSTNDWWESHNLSAEDFQWVYAPDIGVSAVIPKSWTPTSERSGLELAYGSESGGVAFGRIDGGSEEDMAGQLESWSAEWLSRWGLPAAAVAAASAGGTQEDWYLRLEKRLVDRPTDELLRGIGTSQYLAAGDSPVIKNVDDPSCPGTTLMTAVHADDPQIAETVWLSQGLEVQPNHATVSEIAVSSPFNSRHFSMSFPVTWKAAGCPGKFVATEPGLAANIIVTSELAQREPAAYVDEALKAFADNTQFPEFVLEERAQRRLAGNIVAEMIKFSWRSGDLQVRQTQLYAQIAGRAYFFTFTTRFDQSSIYEDEWQSMIDSFRPAASTSLIAIACEGCTDAERLAREAHLNELADQLNVIDARHCNDTTGTADGSVAGAFARIWCTFPSGVRVDFVLWPDPGTLATYTELFKAEPSALVQDWYLYGTDYPRTGDTVEWLETDDARFYWTYDDLLISGNAAWSDTPERLNNWWQTSGALLNE